MNKKNRILVLIDLSEQSKVLLKFASEFSKSINSEVMFVHRIPENTLVLADREINNELTQIQKEEALLRFEDFVRGESFEDSIIHVSSTPILTTLKNLQSENFTDWVLTGIKGTGLLKRLFIGSTTLSIIEESELLTVAVPLRTSISLPKKLIVGINCNFPINRNQFDALLAAMHGQKPKIEFFSVLDKDLDEELTLNYLYELQGEYADFNPDVFISKGENKFETLRQHVKQNDDSFLVLQQGSRSLKDILLRKFMINELVYTGLTPLIVLSK